jgi:hypothetical protein
VELIYKVFSGRGKFIHKYDFMIYTDIADIENHINFWMMIVIYQRLKNTTEIKW